MSCGKFDVGQRVMVRTTITAKYEGASTTMKLRARTEGTILEIDSQAWPEHRVKLNIGHEKPVWVDDPNFLVEIPFRYG